MSTEPIVRTVKRYVCPWCHRGHSRKPSCVAHMQECFANPARRACKTCRNLCGSGPGPASCWVGLEPFTVDCPQWAPWSDGLREGS